MIGIFFNIDDESGKPTFFDFWKPEYSLEEEITFTFNMKESISELFNGKDSYYAYEGSLTTPNCDEIVNWYVFPKPLALTT